MDDFCVKKAFLKIRSGLTGGIIQVQTVGQDDEFVIVIIPIGRRHAGELAVIHRVIEPMGGMMRTERTLDLDVDTFPDELSGLHLDPCLPNGLFDDDLSRVKIRFWILRMQIFQRLDDDMCNDKVAHPFFIRRNDVPGSMISAGLVEHIFISVDIFTPEFSFFQISGIKFP